ncbi:MAG: DinB family protein [Bacteroidota bacterium]
MFDSSIHTIEQFKEILLQLPEACYAQSCEVLSYATIGQHTRHVIELYQCLIYGYDTAEVLYDKRKRDKRIEQEVSLAVAKLQYIQDNLTKVNKPLQVYYNLNGSEVKFDSNYHREVMYNLEHAIHHHALIKIGVRHFTSITLPDSFGVAPSTLQFRKTCVQ